MNGGVGRQWRRAAGLLGLAVACLGAATGPVASANLSVGAKLATEPEDERPSPARVFFGSLDVGPTKVLVSQGAKLVLGPGSLATSGFRTLTATSQSTETLRSGPPGALLHKAEGQLLFGFEWRLRNGAFALYAGPELQAEGIARETLLQYRIGPRFHADLWYGMGPSWALQASFYAASLDDRLWLRLASAWRLPLQGRLGRPTIGPEIEVYRQQGYEKIRLGLHLGGLRLLKLNWRLSAGWERASGGGSSAYATLGIYGRR